jgi:hypothetical protein
MVVKNTSSTSVSTAVEPYIKPKKLESVEEQDRFLRLLSGSCKGNISKVLKKMKMSYWVLNKRKQENPEFRQAVDAIKEHFRSLALDELEEISIEVARDPANRLERKMQLEALAPLRYRDYSNRGGNQTVNIIFGHEIPRYDPNEVKYDEMEEAMKEV